MILSPFPYNPFRPRRGPPLYRQINKIIYRRLLIAVSVGIIVFVIKRHNGIITIFVTAVKGVL